MMVMYQTNPMVVMIRLDEEPLDEGKKEEWRVTDPFNEWEDSYREDS